LLQPPGLALGEGAYLRRLMEDRAVPGRILENEGEGLATVDHPFQYTEGLSGGAATGV